MSLAYEMEPPANFGGLRRDVSIGRDFSLLHCFNNLVNNMNGEEDDNI